MVVLAALPAVHADRASASDPARDRSCGWTVEPTADRENILFPDTATRYLAGVVPVPPGGYVEIKGTFPHARYMSLQTYSTTLQTTSGLRDEQIRPDPGSVNPYLPGADRTGGPREYTVRLVSGPNQGESGPANTLYDTSADGSKSGRGLAYRVYVPDRGTGPFGGVPAPSLTLVLATGQRIPLPTCGDPLTDAGLTPTLAALGPGGWGLPDLGLLANRTPVWHRYVNAPTSYAVGQTDNEHTPESVASAVTGLTSMMPAGLGESVDNKYIYAYLSQEYGRVVAFRAKLPTTPRTRDGEPTMGSGQLRYWSMCTGNRTTQTYGCVADEDVAVDAGGRFTVAISTAADRPANATPGCGIAWVPWGPEPKGIALMRNMLPSAGFDHAIQNAQPGTERETLGEYYPVGTYYATPEAFERAVGCPGAGS
jgi:hypothetical protein